MIGFCTIITKNYLSQVRALALSLGVHHPKAPLYVLVVDQIEGHFQPEKESFETVPLSYLELTDPSHLCFQYGLVELCTAVKPSWMDYLLKGSTLTQLVYLDPDTFVYGKLTEVETRLALCNILLTPYTTEPYRDDCTPNERNLLLFGTFNLGFLGLARSDESFRFLQWWKAKLANGCRNDPARGYFVDQRWIDLVPSLFEGVSVLRHPGYNVAHWNLHYRSLQGKAPEFLVNGKPLGFLHFSGFRPLAPHGISAHQNRFHMDQIGNWKDLYQEYAAKLIELGYCSSYLWPYSYAKFDNGEAIPPQLRVRYLDMGAAAADFGDPFDTRGKGSLYHWWKAQPRGTFAVLPDETKQKLLNMACLHAEHVNSARTSPKNRNQLSLTGNADH